MRELEDMPNRLSHTIYKQYVDHNKKLEEEANNANGNNPNNGNGKPLTPEAIMEIMENVEDEL